MQEFLSRHADRVMGVISGFDRIVFRGHVQKVMFASAMEVFVNGVAVLRDGKPTGATPGAVLRPRRLR